MGKRRTKKQKAKSRERKLKILKMRGRGATRIREHSDAGTRKDKELIVKDLIKSMIVSVVVLGLLVVAYFYLN
ncbi:MAG: hypothetical protein U9Q63_00790 [Patescibacteria group bacterium]|nr:hypothetical protein [Patescibacteria group bacterium]